MKKVLKSRMFAFLIGAIIFGSIGVYAASEIFASSVTYSNTNSGLQNEEGNAVDNVQDAIDVLYKKADGFNSVIDTSIGSSVSIGGYLWHIIGKDENNMYLLMDAGQLSRAYLCDIYSSPNCNWNNSTYTYSWETSTVRSYLNGTFYNSLPANVKAKIVETEICKGVSNGNNSYTYGGYTKSEVESLSAQGASCASGYTKDKVRLITPSEFHNLSQKYNNATYPCSNNYHGYFASVDYITTRISGTWLYDSTTYNWWTTGTVSSGGSGWERYALYVNTDGKFATNVTYNSYEIRPVIVLLK